MVGLCHRIPFLRYIFFFYSNKKQFYLRGFIQFCCSLSFKITPKINVSEDDVPIESGWSIGQLVQFAIHV